MAQMTLSSLLDILFDAYMLCGDQIVNVCVDGKVYEEVEINCVDDWLYIEGYKPEDK